MSGRSGARQATSLPQRGADGREPTAGARQATSLAQRGADGREPTAGARQATSLPQRGADGREPTASARQATSLPQRGADGREPTASARPTGRAVSVADHPLGSGEAGLPSQPAADSSQLRRRLLGGLIYLLLTLVAIAVVVPQFLGHDKDQVVPLLQNVRSEYLVLLILLEIIRYTFFGLVARRLAYGLGRPLPRRDVIQMMVASYSLSRIFSAGGATSFVVRVQYYLRQGLTVGRTLALFIAHNVVSSIALLLVYIFGVGVLWQRGNLAGLTLVAAAGWFVLALLVGAVQVAAGLRPDLIENRVHRALDYTRARGDLLGRWAIPLFAMLAVAAAALGGLWLAGASQFVEQLGAVALVAAGVMLAALLLSALVSVRVRAWLELLVGRRVHSALHSRLARPEASQKFTRDLSEGVRHALGERQTLLVAFALQFIGLCADIGALIVAFRALQVEVPVPVIIAAYIIAYYAQLIAPTPGEAGAMEFALLGVLIGVGVSPLNATTTTLLYRFVSFWLPIPFGVLCYFNLKRADKV